jgi:hypothetical protein
VLREPVYDDVLMQVGSLSWLRMILSFPAMLALLLMTVASAMAWGSMADPDIWWHLRNAEALLKYHQFIRHDMYSFTAAGHPWINSEWLSEIPYYLAWRAWGLMGLDALLTVLVDLIFLGLLYLCYKESGNFKASVFACCFSIFLAVVSFGPRTILFGYAYLVVLLIILQRLRREGRAPLWLIPLLFCLWANTHGSWLVGFIVFSIIVAAGCIRGTWGLIDAEPWSRSQLRELLWTGLASFAALFVNPFGFRLVLYPFDLAFRQKLNVSHVAEWVSVNFHDTRGRVVLALLVALLASALLRSARWTLAELGLVLFGLYSGLTYIRFLFLLGILAAPIIAKMFDFIPPYQPEIDKPLLNAAMMILMIGGMVWYRPTTAGLQKTIDREYPTQALSFLTAHPLDGRMLNFYLWGGYLGWNDRNVKVFLDSRVDIFEYEGVLKDYLDLLAINEPAAILDKYRIRYVLFPPGEALTYVLEHDSGWRVLYSDSVSVLLERIDKDRATVTAPGTHAPETRPAGGTFPRWTKVTFPGRAGVIFPRPDAWVRRAAWAAER